jgi:protein O-mannosyl-transferase
MPNNINISSKKQILIIYILLAVVTLAVYWQVNQYDFVNIDDNVYVYQNIHIQSGITLNGFRWAFSTTTSRLWNPMIWLSLMFDYQLYGLNAGGYHLTNLILHIMSSLLLFWLFNRMTGAIWKSAFVAGLFALHPLHVESVAWVSERKDVLSAFFWMLTLCLYVYYTEKPVTRRYLLVISSFVLALISKPMVITLPIIMILLDYWPLKRFESKKDSLLLWQLREKTPFLILSAVVAIISIYTMHDPSIEYFSLISRFANAPVSFVTYLEKTFWPHDMAVFYPFSNQLPVWKVLGSILLILLISIAAIAMIKRMPFLFVGWLWYALTLLPVIGIIQNGEYAMADRYTYLPSIGIAVMLAWGTPFTIKSEHTRKILFPTTIAFLVFLSLLSWAQCHYWKNSIELFSHTLLVTKDNFFAHNNLGFALCAEGKVEEAIDNYNKALHIKPNVSSYNHRGIAYAILSQYQRAIEDFNQAIRLKPNYAEAYNNRGSVHLLQGNNSLGCVDVQKACALGECKALKLAKGEGRCP